MCGSLRIRLVERYPGNICATAVLLKTDKPCVSWLLCCSVITCDLQVVAIRDHFWADEGDDAKDKCPEGLLSFPKGALLSSCCLWFWRATAATLRYCAWPSGCCLPPRHCCTSYCGLTVIHVVLSPCAMHSLPLCAIITARAQRRQHVCRTESRRQLHWCVRWQIRQDSGVVRSGASLADALPFADAVGAVCVGRW